MAHYWKNLPFWHHADVIVEAEMGSSGTYKIQIAGGFSVWGSDKALKQRFSAFTLTNAATVPRHEQGGWDFTVIQTELQEYKIRVVLQPVQTELY